MASSSCNVKDSPSKGCAKHEGGKAGSDVPDGWELLEEEFVAADFSGVVENSILAPGGSLRILDIDGASPLIEVGGRALFRGSFNDVLGTLLFFKKEHEQMLDYHEDLSMSTKDITDPDDAPSSAQEPSVVINKYAFVCKSSKLLKMERVFLKEKEEEGM